MAKRPFNVMDALYLGNPPKAQDPFEDSPLIRNITGGKKTRTKGPRVLPPKPKASDYVNTAVNMALAARPSAVQQNALELGKQVGAALPDMVQNFNLSDLVPDVSGYADYVRNDPANAFADFNVVGAGRDFLRDFERAAELRAQGRDEEAADLEKFALPFLALGAIPGGKGARGVKKGVEEAVELAAKGEGRAAAKGTKAFAAVREGAAPERQTAVQRIPMRESAPELPSGVTGSYDATRNEPFTFRGKQPWELTSSEMADLGDKLGVPNLGPLNPPKTYRYMDEGEFEVPGGLEGTFTYEDMMRLKGQGINADRIDPSLHQDIQRKLMRSMEGEDGLSDARVIQGLTFGMTSPNQPLFPNQLAMSRLRPASQEQLQQVVDMRPWGLNDPVSAAERAALSKELTSAYGLNAGAAGGLGVSGSVDYSRLADMNDLFLRDPAFFHRAEGEDWTDFVQRINNQIPGLGNKTTSFGVAWQPEAGVSAIDRHMVNRYMDTLLADEARRAAFENRALNLARTRAAREGKEGPSDFSGVKHGLIQELLLSEVGKSPGMKLRTSEGLLNPRIPEGLRGTEWIAEPHALELMGDDYKAIIAANEAATQGSGLHLFGNQWNIWDRIRRRFEPHENMFPGLELIPRMSVDQLKVIDKGHALSGHKNYTKELIDGDPRLQPTKPVAHEGLRYFSTGGFAVRKQKNLSAKPRGTKASRRGA